MVVEVLSNVSSKKLKRSGAHLLLQIHTKMLNDNTGQQFNNGTLGSLVLLHQPPDFLADFRLPVHFAPATVTLNASC